MLTKVIVPMTARRGEAYASEQLTKGTWVKISGTFSAGDISSLPTGQKDKPGFASAGDYKVVPAVVGDTMPCFPVDKLTIVPEGADSDNDTILAGAMVVYFTEGRFETDQFTSVSGTGAEYGDYLKIGASSKLVEEASGQVKTSASVARVYKVHYGGNARHTYDRLEFEMLTNKN